jgi:hypothetical protein
VLQAKATEARENGLNPNSVDSMFHPIPKSTLSQEGTGNLEDPNHLFD